MGRCNYNPDEVLFRYVMNRMDSKEEDAYLSHLMSCDTCMSKLKAIRALSFELSGIETEKVQSASTRRLGIIIASAAALIAICSVLIFKPYSKDKAGPAIVGVDSLPSHDTVPALQHESSKPAKQEIAVSPRGKDSLTESPETDKMSRKLATGQTMQQEGVIQMIYPAERRITYKIKQQDDNILEFRWKNSSQKGITLVVRRGTEILNRFQITQGDSFRLNLSGFAQYTEIEWELSTQDGDNQQKGVVVLNAE